MWPRNAGTQSTLRTATLISRVIESAAEVWGAAKLFSALAYWGRGMCVPPRQLALQSCVKCRTAAGPVWLWLIGCKQIVAWLGQTRGSRDLSQRREKSEHGPWWGERDSLLGAF